jgi:hypothetical protein
LRQSKDYLREWVGFGLAVKQIRELIGFEIVCFLFQGVGRREKEKREEERSRDANLCVTID